MAVTRFPKGLTNVASSAPLGNHGALDPTKFITCFEDFVGPTSFPLASSGLAAKSNDSWTLTVTEAGAGNATSAVADIVGGGVTITTDAADNDLVFVQATNAAFKPVAGKKAWFKAAFAITDANANAASINECEWYAGLMVRDTDTLSSTGGDGVTDGIFFMSEDGSQDVYLYCQKNATTGQLGTKLAQTLTVATQTEFAFYFDGKRYINVYINGVEVKTIDLTTTLATYLPDTVLNVSFGVKNGEAVAKALTVDYIFAAQER